MFAISAILFAVLYFKQNLRIQNELKDAQTKSQQIISQAILKSQNLVSSSELEAIKLTTDSKYYQQTLESKFNTEAEKAIAMYLKDFSDYTLALKTKLEASQLDYSNYCQISVFQPLIWPLLIVLKDQWL